MATKSPLDIKKLASDAGVAVEAYDTYDTDEETLNAAHRFAAAILEQLAVISAAKPLDSATFRAMAAAVSPK
ncbi:hypothetical protein BH09PSE5_BH09PSE5_32420 [soil metagenome]